FAQVDTTKDRRSKSDTSWNKQKKDTNWNKRDTAWNRSKRDTNQVNLNNNNMQDDRRAGMNEDDQHKNADAITSQFFGRENKKLWRRARAQTYCGSC
ncbi:MAG TPA: hypothetical protein VJ111_13205, partial [Chitinophagaceae bacterium]|nr:hypothetical protein [Chitinophagaceae bacterium]